MNVTPILENERHQWQKPDVLDVLTVEENSQLELHEEIVRSGLAQFLTVGRSLAAIQASRLYRATHKTFDQYLAETFGLDRSTAYRKINASALIDGMSPNGDIPVWATEYLIRPLTKLDEVQRTEVWKEILKISETRQPTATVVTALVNEKIKGKLSEPDVIIPEAEPISSQKSERFQNEHQPGESISPTGVKKCSDDVVTAEAKNAQSHSESSELQSHLDRLYRKNVFAEKSTAGGRMQGELFWEVSMLISRVSPNIDPNGIGLVKTVFGAVTERLDAAVQEN